MGQYYLVVNTDKEQYLCAHDYNEGLKLMEHSYINDDMMNIVEKLLSKQGNWHKDCIVWAGDYADKNQLTVKYRDPVTGRHDKINLHTRAEYEYERLDDLPTEIHVFQYLLNHTKKQYVDLNRIISINENDTDWVIHPLPLLTCEGNGRGGGDFYGKNEYIGVWRNDSISMENEIPEDFDEIKPDFKDDYEEDYKEDYKGGVMSIVKYLDRNLKNIIIAAVIFSVLYFGGHVLISIILRG